MAKKVMCLKLISGEEIIADVTRDGAIDTYVVENPAYINMTPKQGGGVSLNIAIPFLMYSKTRTFKIPLQSVVVDFEPTEELRNAYSQTHGSGIVTASASDLDNRRLITG